MWPWESGRAPVVVAGGQQAAVGLLRDAQVDVHLGQQPRIARQLHHLESCSGMRCNDADRHYVVVDVAIGVQHAGNG